MEDIDQSRFALMTALSEAHKARPDDYPDPGTLVAMSDDGLRSYAVGLLHLLETEPKGDELAVGLHEQLWTILHAAP